MKRISLVGYFGILAGSLVLAWLTWVEGPKAPSDKATIFPCGKGDIVKLAYAAADRTVTISKRESRYSGEPSWWVEVVRPSPSAAVKGSQAAQGKSADEAGVPEGSLPSGASPVPSSRASGRRSTCSATSEASPRSPGPSSRRAGAPASPSSTRARRRRAFADSKSMRWPAAAANRTASISRTRR